MKLSHDLPFREPQQVTVARAVRVLFCLLLSALLKAQKARGRLPSPWPQHGKRGFHVCLLRSGLHCVDHSDFRFIGQTTILSLKNIFNLMKNSIMRSFYKHTHTHTHITHHTHIAHTYRHTIHTHITHHTHNIPHIDI